MRTLDLAFCRDPVVFRGILAGSWRGEADSGQHIPLLTGFAPLFCLLINDAEPHAVTRSCVTCRHEIHARGNFQMIYRFLRIAQRRHPATPTTIPSVLDIVRSSWETSKMASLQQRVLVVGGGPAGSCTAYFLAKSGFEVVVAERAKDIGKQ